MTVAVFLPLVAVAGPGDDASRSASGLLNSSKPNSFQCMLAIIANGGNTHGREFEQIKLDLIVQHREQLAQASKWRRLLIRFQIHFEAQRILQSRLYAQKPAEKSC